MTHVTHRGFTLLIAIILSSVALALALALLDIAYKQVTLALAAKQSQYAFYNADSALECALYWDQKFDAFNQASPAVPGSGISCANLTVTDYLTTPGSVRETSFTIPCENGGKSATVTVRKATDAATAIYANGYNTCNDSDPRRIERGLKVTY